MVSGVPRTLWTYLGGAAAARAGDEMSGPAVLLLGLAVAGLATGSELLAAVIIAAAVGGPVFGALLDRSRRPDRVLAATLAAYSLGIFAVGVAAGRLPTSAVVAIALAAGLFNPSVAGGWTAQLPRIVTGRELDRGSALDAMTYGAASLAGPALAALVAAGAGARVAVLTAAALVALAVPGACSVPRYTSARPAGPGPQAPHRQMAAGFAAIAARRPLLRATLTSVVSYVGIGMLIVCCPVHARADLRHRRQLEDRRNGRRSGGGRAAGRALGDRLPARGGRHRAVRRGSLPAGRPASGPGWTGTRYAFTASPGPGSRIKLSGTVTVDQQGRARALVLTTRFTSAADVFVMTQALTSSEFGAPVTVTPPPADQTFSGP